VIDHKEIADPQTITDVMDRAFKENGLDVMQHEHTKVEDDWKRGKRHITVQSRKVFTVGEVPWLKEKKSK